VTSVELDVAKSALYPLKVTPFYRLEPVNVSWFLRRGTDLTTISKRTPVAWRHTGGRKGCSVLRRPNG
jgi:hypothetical protein